MRSRLVRARLVGLLVTIAAVAFSILVFIPLSMPWSRPFHLQVQAGAYGELNPGAWVELSGAKIGSVDSVEYNQGYALIRLSIDPRFRDQLHADTAAAVRPHGLLGPKYVYLQGGSTGQLQDGSTIPLSRTTVSTDFDQVINSLQPDVRANLKTIFVELGRAAEGRGTQVNAAFQALGQSSGDVKTTTGVLHNRDDDLAGLIAASEQLDRDLQYAPIDRQIANTDLVLSGLVQVEDSLGSGIDNTANVMQGLATAMNGNGANLAHILAKGPATINELRTVASEADAIIVGANPVLPCLMQAVLETKSAFAGQDGNGHFVRIQVVPTNVGTAPPQPCAGSSTSQAPPLNDQELIALFLGH
ncbi:MAG TPA: MlaD family protein [Candidatus Dormibacteraeota bacterium]|nr:MlaD family protein [Candidatus Dormibacteraeota bacterium]